MTLTMTIPESGTLEIAIENPMSRGRVLVSKNGSVLANLDPNTKRTITERFQKEDVLEIKEEGYAIILITSLKFTCGASTTTTAPVTTAPPDSTPPHICTHAVGTRCCGLPLSP